MNLAFNYDRYLNEIQSKGLNYVQIFSGTYTEGAGNNWWNTRDFPYCSVRPQPDPCWINYWNIKDNTIGPDDKDFISPWKRTQNRNIYKFDLSQWDTEYFTRLKDFVRKADEKGIVVSYIFFTPFWQSGPLGQIPGNDFWKRSPMNIRNNINNVGNIPSYTIDGYNSVWDVRVGNHNGGLTPYMNSMIAKVVQELNEFDNVIYFLTMEPNYHGAGPANVMSGLFDSNTASKIREAEASLPKKHLIIQNAVGDDYGSDIPLADADILSWDNNSLNPVLGFLDFRRLYNKPVGITEVAYKYNDYAFHRRMAWKHIIAGFAIWDVLDLSFTKNVPDGSVKIGTCADGTVCGLTTGDPTLRGQLKILKEFIHSFDFVKMTPDNSVIKSGPAGTQALVEAGKQYAVYLPLSASASVIIDLPAGDYKAEWVNTKTGVIDKTENISGHTGGNKTLVPPAYSEDIALRILFSGFVPPVTPVPTPSSQSPAVSITSPANGQTFDVNANITLSATIANFNGIVTSVSFRKADDTLLATCAGPTFSCAWLNVPRGNYTIKAVAVDSFSVTATSSTIKIIVGSAVSPTSSQLVYREYIKDIGFVRDEWRVTDPDAPYYEASEPGNNPSAFLPNPKIPFNIPPEELDGASWAEAIVSIWGGHIGTIQKRLRFNVKPWITIPELSTTPTSGECYLSHWNPTVRVPVEDLLGGTNILEGTSGGQTCGNFGWGQWAWYEMILRVYTCADHVEGMIDSYQSGSTLPENPTLTVSFDDPDNIGVKRVDYFAYYDGYDNDGDGVFQDYHVSYYRNGQYGLYHPDPKVLLPKDHIGTSTTAPFSVVWDTSWVPDQNPGSVKIMARILGNNGVWYVTPEITGLSLDRPSSSVILYKPENVPTDFNVRFQHPEKRSNITIPSTAPLADITGAKLLVRSWNGLPGGVRVPGSNYVSIVNSKGVYPAGNNYGYEAFYSYDEFNIQDAKNVLAYGKNDILFHSDTNFHSQEIEWPGPAVVVKYSTKITVATAATPTFSPDSTVAYTSPQLVTIASTPGAIIRYTIDGTDPTEFSPKYTAPVSVPTTRTIKAKAWLTEGLPSGISSATYTISSSVSAPWWNNAWKFRLSVVTEAAGYERKDKPIEFDVNFTEIFNALGESGSLSSDSIRVVETEENGILKNDSVPFQFDKDASYNAATSAKGILVFIANGITPANGVRYYKVYFDMVGQPFVPLTVAPQITLEGDTTVVTDEAMAAYKVIMPGSTYYFQKNAGGFSSLVDAGGNDWINYNKSTQDTAYRGIPNAGHPGVYLHPGGNCCDSDIVAKGPLKVSIHTKSKSTTPEMWETRWDFYPGYARLTMLQAAHPYWVLYEGTPGGSLYLDNYQIPSGPLVPGDYMVRNNGTPEGLKTMLKTRWTEDIKGDEWGYFTDPNLHRSIFLANHTDDNLQDLYWPYQNILTVFGFGRSDTPLSGLMSTVPRQFTIGLMNGEDRVINSKTVYSAYKDLVVTKALAEKLGSPTIFVPPVVTPVPPTLLIPPTPSIIPPAVCTFACSGGCDDSNPCTDDFCNFITRKCDHAYSTSSCDDGNLCTQADTCSGGLCRGTPKSCADTDECTYDSCDPDTGLCSNPNVCGGLVPCGRLVDNPATTQINETAPCDLCSLFYMIKSIINYAAQISFGLALLMFTIAGLLYATSAGDNRKATLAKNTIRYALIGLLFIFLAWLAIAVILQALGYGNAGTWNQVNCVLR